MEDIWSEIVTIPSRIITGIEDLFTFLFVPEENFILDNFNEVKDEISNKVQVDVNELKQLENVEVGSYTGLRDFDVEIYGQRVTMVNIDWLDEYINRFHNIARGFFWPLMFIYNINQVYFLIRGTYIFTNGSSSNKGASTNDN